MEKTAQPVRKNLEKVSAVVREMAGQWPAELELDLGNTEYAFAHRSDQELKKVARLFGLMNNQWLVGIGSKLGLAAIRMHLPFVESAVKYTIFEQFCGGTTLTEAEKSIRRLGSARVLSILDYGAEGKETEEDFNSTMKETIRALEFSKGNSFIPMVSTKVTGMARFGLLEAVSRGDALSPAMQTEWENVVKRIDAICHAAMVNGLTISLDAEETWIQQAIDDLAVRMAQRYNKERVVVYNTYQLYRTDRLSYLKDSYEQARQEGYLIGAKLVRGAYLEKERNRAEAMGYPSPIQSDKEATDRDYNLALRFCLEHYQQIALCNASHNADSALLQAALMVQRNIPRNHPHALFAQLYGMSDNLTFNLAQAGFNAGKYVIYGAVKDVMPYLIRRAQENTSVSGDMSREYQFVLAEIKRRRSGPCEK
ncbi:MAG: proline dehydrogenase family protein [Haliscomenobacter sp.]|nr:proline dehydrogenase family protein [Haliscomenobacter sp.]